MLLTESISIILTSKNYRFYKKYIESEKIGDTLIIQINNLNKSNVIVKVMCDYCQSEYECPYNTYLKSIKVINKVSCKKCFPLKLKDSLNLKYGVDNPMKLIEFKEKVKSTNLEKYGSESTFGSNIIKQKIKNINLNKYGCEYYLSSEDSKKKRRKTNLKKYGVEFTSKLKENRDKFKETNINRYGVCNPMQNDVIKEKVKLTNIDKYGVDSYSKTDEFKEKVKSTNLEKYGVDNPMMVDEFKERAKKTNIEKYGVEHVLKSELFISKLKNTNLERYGFDTIQRNVEYRKKYKIDNDINHIKTLGNGISLFNCNNGHQFEISVTLYHSRINGNIPLCVVCNPIGEQRSFKEDQLYTFISSLNIKTIKNYRIDKKEIDIFVPKLNIGFEFNGLYWHSDLYKDNKYHLEKTIFFKERGIRIIHIWEDDWDNKRHIIESQIANLLGKTPNKIYARKTKICEIERKEAISFLNDNHILGGYKQIRISYGSFYNGELVSVMTFDHFEGRKKMTIDEWNLSRFCSKTGVLVVGVASKFLRFHLRNFDRVKRIISYSDLDWSNGNLYNMLGFRKVSQSKPDYKYLVGKYRKHKSNFRKRCNDVLTESEINKNLPKIFDCGKEKFEIII